MRVVEDIYVSKMYLCRNLFPGQESSSKDVLTEIGDIPKYHIPVICVTNNICDIFMDFQITKIIMLIKPHLE